MSFRRTPNPNRNHPIYCPYCAGEDLYPNEGTDFAWKCHECLRIADVRFYGQDDPDSPHAPTPSTAEALQRSLAHHGHSAVLRREANGPSRPTLITLSHGSRHPEAVVGAREITAAAGHALGVDALAAHLEFTQPDLTGVARALVDKHTTRAVVVPLLFTQAYHAKVDVPTAIADAAAATGIELSLAGRLGQGRDVAEVLAQRVRADAHPNATVALYPVGTTHPDAAAATEALGAHVGETTGQRTVVVPATGKGEGRRARRGRVARTCRRRPRHRLRHTAPAAPVCLPRNTVGPRGCLPAPDQRRDRHRRRLLPAAAHRCGADRRRALHPHRAKPLEIVYPVQTPQ
ncbi:sirohydrochlorin chelatase [Corynebacterium cystitidis]|uniref:sirohydrochlorin chelatase n=1 Tax=Corynebacterium cystitidis TaxID=35757 RepID=UPI002811B01F|nr:CbiX/SirB N-terminal domain-containing protein [Corynebacterium cystitidis]